MGAFEGASNFQVDALTIRSAQRDYIDHSHTHTHTSPIYQQDGVNGFIVNGSISNSDIYSPPPRPVDLEGDNLPRNRAGHGFPNQAKSSGFPDSKDDSCLPEGTNFQTYTSNTQTKENLEGHGQNDAGGHVDPIDANRAPHSDGSFRPHVDRPDGESLEPEPLKEVIGDSSVDLNRHGRLMMGGSDNIYHQVNVKGFIINGAIDNSDVLFSRTSNTLIGRRTEEKSTHEPLPGPKHIYHQVGIGGFIINGTIRNSIVDPYSGYIGPNIQIDSTPKPRPIKDEEREGPTNRSRILREGISLSDKAIVGRQIHERDFAKGSDRLSGRGRQVATAKRALPNTARVQSR
ncbi:hypothetical protein D9611_012310 [Ephemerocybe angulata]|uniref:Uncharacterized protein n=1 Tax=Ephemerocybe angulata TaxID=980116 RepID=A0A8H5ASV3_9AGAR|nr:hypothetical protein D9611_012310 [Tulosesus angulatus]